MDSWEIEGVVRKTARTIAEDWETSRCLAALFTMPPIASIDGVRGVSDGFVRLCQLSWLEKMGGNRGADLPMDKAQG
jgi:hypothetical protein